VSDLLTHWAVYDDCRRLSRFADGLEPDFARVLEEQRDFARLGAIVRGPWRPPVLAWARERWDDPEARPEAERRLAFVLSGYTHVACDRVMKQLRLKLATEDEQSENPTPGDVRRLVYAYQDVHLFRHVYLDGEEEPFNRFLLVENDTEPGRALERISRTLFVNGLLSLRTTVPDPDRLDRGFLEPLSQKALRRVREDGEGPMKVVGTVGLARRPVYEWLLGASEPDGSGRVEEGWDHVKRLLTPDLTDSKAALDNLLQGVQWLYVDVEALVRAYNEPDPALVEKFRVESEFYDAGDPAIAVARAVQRGEEVAPEEGRTAVAEGANGSAYGRALELGIEYLRRVSAFWRGEADGIDAPNYKPLEYLRWNAERNRRAFLAGQRGGEGAR
jgi:hypothetical protein